MEISSCIASLQLLSLRATPVTILYVMVWTTWSWVQYCPKLNWASRTIVSIWWSEAYHLTGTHFTVASDWVTSIDETYTWWQDQIWCFIQWPYQQWTLVWPMLCYVSHGHMGVLEAEECSPLLMAFWDNDLHGYICAWNYIMWPVPFCFVFLL